jgi:hypothetical protein
MSKSMVETFLIKHLKKSVMKKLKNFPVERILEKANRLI